MLGESVYSYIYHANDYFNNNIKKASKDNTASLMAIIVYFYKEDNQIKKYVRKIDTNVANMDFATLDIVSKYYLTGYWMNALESLWEDDFWDDSYVTIYGIGDFDILFDRDNHDDRYDKAIKMFKEYDLNYTKMTFPFTDEEYLKQNTQKLDGNFNGKFIR